MPKKTIADLGSLQGKKVLIRVDFNVPLDKISGDDQERPPHPRRVCRLSTALLGSGRVGHRHDAIVGRPEKADAAGKDKLLTMDKSRRAARGSARPPSR